MLCSILSFVFWIFPPLDTAVQLESADSKQSAISKYLFQDIFWHIFLEMRKMHNTFWLKGTFNGLALPLHSIEDFEVEPRSSRLPCPRACLCPKLRWVGLSQFHQFRWKSKTMVFCYHNCSNVVWEKIVLVWGKKLRKKFANSIKNFWDMEIIGNIRKNFLMHWLLILLTEKCLPKQKGWVHFQWVRMSLIVLSSELGCSALNSIIQHQNSVAAVITQSFLL